MRFGSRAGALLTPLPILYEDAALLVVSKPSGLPCHAGLAARGDTVASRLRGLGVVHLVHRLDRGASGALLIARTKEAARELGALLAERLIERGYVALVRGEPPPSVVVDHPVPRDEGGERVPAQTAFVTIARHTVSDSPLRERRYAWIGARPRTGRFHQIRRHAKHLGHPIVGDVNYGRSEHNRFVRERFGLSRLALHAEELLVPSPATGSVVRVVAPLPEDLCAVLERMGIRALDRPELDLARRDPSP